MADRLTLALSEPLLEIKQRYHAILWATDRLGRSGTVGGGPNTLPSVLRKRGFSLISACYPAGWTYKWTPAYRHAPDIGPLDVSCGNDNRARYQLLLLRILVYPSKTLEV